MVFTGWRRIGDSTGNLFGPPGNLFGPPPQRTRRPEDVLILESCFATSGTVVWISSDLFLDFVNQNVHKKHRLYIIRLIHKTIQAWRCTAILDPAPDTPCNTYIDRGSTTPNDV